MESRRRRTRPAGSPQAPRQEAPGDSGLVGLQRAVGNRAVTNLLAGSLDRPASAPSPELTAGIADARGRGTTPPDDVRELAEAGSGSDLSGVRIHDDPQAWELAGELGAHAFADRGDVFFRRGAYRPDTPEGGELLAHELAHASDQLAGAVSHGPQLKALDKARTQVTAERSYDTAAEQLELALGPHLSVEPKVNEIVDEMLVRLRRVVDAWAWATRGSKSEIYGTEFAFPHPTYYGSFLLTAKEIKKVFEKEGQPLRKKLNLVYYATRNNNLGKYLELAALELKDAAKGAAADRKIRVPGPGGKGEQEVTVRAGFAKRAGLEEVWANEPAPHTARDEAKAAGEKRIKEKHPVFGKERSSAVSMGPTNADLSKEKRYGAFKGLDLAETRTLTRGDVPDITAGEMRLIYEREGQKVPKWISHKDKTKFRANAQTKIVWEQGGENIEVVPEGETRRIAMETRSRLEGGISGSTDLMMHASKHLGFSNLNELKAIRTALLAWMLSNRDHSFFEIMKVSADYGPPFNLDKSRPGAEYEDPDHFYPLDSTAVKDFDKLMPQQHMPSYYLGAQYAGSVKTNLPKLGSAAAVVDNLRRDGVDLPDVWKTDARSYDLAQWLAVQSRVRQLGLQAGRTEDALRNNRIELQRLMRDNSWLHVLKSTVDPKAATNLRALIAGIHGATSVVDDAYLTGAGIPASVFAPLEEYKRYDLARLRVAVEAAAPAIGAATGKARDAGVKAVEASLPYQAVEHHLGGSVAGLVLSTLLNRFVGPTHALSTEKRAAKQLGEYGAFIAAYPTVQTQRARLLALGIPESWLVWIEKAKDPALGRSQVDSLATVIAGAGYAAGEAHDSKTNLTARKTVEASPEYRRVERIVGDRYIVTVYSYLVEKAHGGMRVPAAEQAKAYGRKSTAEQLDELVALGVPRDIAETKDAATAINALRRAVLEAPFDTGKPGTDPANRNAWAALIKTPAFDGAKAVVARSAATEALAGALVTSVHGAGVLTGAAALRARGMQQRLGPSDRQRFGKPAGLNAPAIAGLPTPALKGEGAPKDSQEQAKREERYWASGDAAKTMKTNVDMTVNAQMGALRAKYTKDASARATAVDDLCKAFIAKQNDPSLSLEKIRKEVTDLSVADQVEQIIALTPQDQLLAQLDPSVRAAIVAIQNLTPRERGALFQYTNKLHEQIGYATQSFSTSTDFGPEDVEKVTEKLRSLEFMLPMLEAMHSALEKLPPYAGKVYSGRKSGSDLKKLDDAGRLAYAKKHFADGKNVTYSYPLSAAKTVDASFIVKQTATSDVALVIDGIKSGKEVEYVSNKPGEQEVLFPQGARFEVVGTSAQPPPEHAGTETNDKLWVFMREA